MFSRAAVEVLIDKGACSLDEVIAAMRELDESDDRADGGLDPKVLSDELGIRHSPDKKALFSASTGEGERLSPAEAAEREERRDAKIAAFRARLARRRKR